jgi:hypothetical protein
VGNLSAPSGENVGFTKLNADISRTQTLFEPWAGASVSLLALLTGQYSNDVVPQVEQFYLGGLRLNPGYYSGEVTGDSALAAYGELRLDDSWEAALIGRSFDIGAQFFGFWSWGETWNNWRSSRTAVSHRRWRGATEPRRAIPSSTWSACPASFSIRPARGSRRCSRMRFTGVSSRGSDTRIVLPGGLRADTRVSLSSRGK